MRIATAHSWRQTYAYLHPISVEEAHRAIIEAMRTAEAMNTSTTTSTATWLPRALFLGAAVIIVALDQATKGLVRTFMDRGETWPDGWPIRLHHVTNTGAAFGILKDQTGFLIVTTVIGLAAIYLYYRYPPFDHLVAPIAIGMMLGGAIGNLVDRVRLGRVTDFIDFPFWPSFNVADSSITIGIAVLLLGYVLFAERPPPKAEREDAGADG
ncbi:MAG: signal peptidase II [Chloroflexi bacterium]|nr:signal peptidase II [Chloroflexota bacterium]